MINSCIQIEQLMNALIAYKMSKLKVLSFNACIRTIHLFVLIQNQTNVRLLLVEFLFWIN